MITFADHAFLKRVENDKEACVKLNESQSAPFLPDLTKF